MTRARALVAAALLLTASPGLAAKKPLASGERIDVNRASVVELMRLPGVGRKKAEAITARRGRAPFRRLEDLLSVKGVSPAWLERERSHLSVGPAALPTATRGAKPESPARDAAPGSGASRPPAKPQR